MKNQSSLDFPEQLSEKYRPRRIEEFIGLKGPRAVLSSFARKPMPSAWLFLGESGTGKTSMGLALAAQLPAELFHIPSRQCDLEAVQRVAQRCQYVPGGFSSNAAGAKLHLILCDEADQMSHAAQLAFLSLLDSTARPPATLFIFTANGTKLLEDRFLSRLHTLEFSNEGTSADLPDFLASVYKKETNRKRCGLDLKQIAAQADGNIRNALNKLELAMLGDSSEDPAPVPPVRRPAPRPADPVRYVAPLHDCAEPLTFDRLLSA